MVWSPVIGVGFKYVFVVVTRGLKIDGEYLSHLRFANDIVLITNTPRATTNATVIS